MAVPAALTKAQAAEGDIDVNELVFGHIGDAYQWHIAKFGDTEVSIPLPVIVKSSTGWHVFSSARLEEGPYEGLYVAEGGAYDGKIVERNAAGEEVRPLDISITKNVLGLFINSAVLLVIMMSCVRWYKKHPLEDGAPKGGVGMIEATVLSIYNDVIKGCIGENYRRYAPYLLTAFFFVLVNNLMGLIPIFPGGANVTGNIAITLVLALCTFVLTNVYGTKAYWKEIFWPDVPTWYLYQTVCTDDPFVCQHHGRTCGRAQSGGHYLHHGEVGSGYQRLDDGGVGGIQHFHECAGNSGGIHPGIRLHDAVGRVYRSVAGEGTCRKIIDSKKIKV